MCGLLSGSAYLYDPQNVYRWNTRGVRCYQPTFSAAGALRHYDYDLAIIGSSMVQNWDAEALADTLHCKPLKLTIGAMTPGEILFLYNAAHQTGRAGRYIVNIDLHRIAAAEQIAPDAGRFPKVMFHPTGISQFRYLLGFETWFRFMPADLACTAALHLPIPASFRDKIAETSDINAMCAWDESTRPGTSALLHAWRTHEKAFNEGDNADFARDPVRNVRVFSQQLAQQTVSNETLTLVLPPYSILYWADKTPDQLQALLEMRQALGAFADAHPSVTLADFQSIAEINDLEQYVDANHCGAQIRLRVQNALADGTFNADGAQTARNNALLLQYLDAFHEQYGS